jgi:membrane associated rhomboid family serine protease
MENNRVMEKFFVNMKIMVSTVTSGILDFKRIFLTYISVLLTSGIVYAVSQVYPNIGSMLSASRSTPWGIITSIFAHSDLSHLAFNMGSLFLLMLLFAFCNSTFHLHNKKRIELFFLVSIFVFAIISNILWIIFRPNPSIGASGLVYAVEGTLVGFSFANGIQVCNLSKFKNQRISTATIVLMNIVVFAILFAQILLNVDSFLSVGQGVNIIAHGASFLLGFFVSVPWYYLIGKLSILD